MFLLKPPERNKKIKDKEIELQKKHHMNYITRIKYKLRQDTQT